MSWTAPASKATSEVLTSTAYNNEVVENTNFLHSPPAVSVYDTAANSIPDSTLQELTFNSEEFDTDSMHTTSTSTDANGHQLRSHITFNTAGIYVVGCNVEWAANNSNYRAVHIVKNGSVYLASTTTPSAGGGAVTHQSPSRVAKFAVNDYIEVFGYQTSGGALNISVSSERSARFWAHWIGTGN